MANQDEERRSTGDNGSDGYGDNGNGRSTELRASPMMAHLLDALESGTDIGQYGRLVFAMVARHFMERDELVSLLSEQPGMGEEQARALVAQVEGKDYNPPKRERILEWQAQQDFPICPDPDDPRGCNVYRELQFPDGIYDNIGQFWEEKAKSENQSDE